MEIFNDISNKKVIYKINVFKKYFFFCSINVFCFYKILGMKYSEEQFLELLNSKQPKIFRILYQEYYNFMVSFSLNYVSRKEIAEDIVSDLFANIWTNNYQFQTFSNVICRPLCRPYFSGNLPGLSGTHNTLFLSCFRTPSGTSASKSEVLYHSHNGKHP